MYAEIISIGTELTSGKNLDTNAQWLSQRLAEIGIQVGWHTTIADDLQINFDAFQLATQRAKLILVTGGLGPTQDDLTREVIASVAGDELVHHPESEEHIRGIFKSRGREMPERNRGQAFYPASGEPIHNDRGTAPGIWIKIGDAHLAAMPGVPSEMHHMFTTEVMPRLYSLGLTQGVQLERKINCFGAGESTIEERIMDLTRRGHVPEVGITASNATISMRILAQAPTREQALSQIAPVEATIRERLGDLVFGVDSEQLQDIVVPMLHEQRLTLSIVEGVTGGCLARFLTDVPGGSTNFRGGLVISDNEVAVSQLGVPETLIEQHGMISAEVVERMARGALTRFDTDLALATVGLARPPETEEKPVGLVYVALAWKKGARSKSYNWLASPAEIQSRTAKMALNLLRHHLRSLDPKPRDDPAPA